MKRARLALLVFSFLAGCAAQNIQPDHSLASRSGQGVLAMSMTYTPAAPTFTLIYRSIGTKDKNAIMSNTLPHPEDWTSPSGRLVVIELPVGSYEIVQWAANTLESRKPFSVPFKVVEGKVNYIGNVHVDVLKDLGTFRVLVNDKSERDIPLVLSRYKKISEPDVLKNISAVK